MSSFQHLILLHWTIYLIVHGLSQYQSSKLHWGAQPFHCGDVWTLSPLQFSLEKVTPPKACTCLQFHQTTSQLGPCLWRQLDLLSGSKKCLWKTCICKKESLLSKSEYQVMSPILLTSWEYLETCFLAWHDMLAQKVLGPRTWAEKPPNDVVCTRK